MTGNEQKGPAMRKHSKTITIMDVKNFYNRALVFYLKTTYPDYRLFWTDRKDIRAGVLAELAPALLILPGGADSSKDIAEAEIPYVKRYLASGGSLLAICAGMYAGFDGNIILGKDDKLKGFRQRSLGIFDSVVMFKERSDSAEPKSAPNVDSYGRRIDAFYFNGPYVVPYGYANIVREGKKYFDLEKIENAGLTPLLWAMDEAGKTKCETIITLAAQKLPGGGCAVASTNHLDTPFEIQLEAYKAELATARRFMKNPPVGRPYPERRYEHDVGFLEKLASLGHRLYPSKSRAQALADTVFEDILGINGRRR